MTVCRPVAINDRADWTLLLPEHRAERTEWPTWEHQRLADMSANLGPGDVIFDVGAEQGDLPGLWSLWGCEVVLIEPNPLAWANIRCVWEANDLRPPLAWWVGFLSDTCDASERPEIAEPFGTEGWPACAYGEAIGATGFKHLSQETDVTAQITLDALVGLVGVPPTACTLDVEGSELTVLHGAARTLREHHPKVWVSVHTDDVWMDEMYGGVRAEDVHAFMANFGYTPEVLGLDHELHVAYR